MANRKKKARHATAFAWLRDNPRSPTKPAGGQRARPKRGTKGPKRIVKEARKNARKHTDAERDQIMAARRKLEKATKKAKGRGKAASKPKRKAAKGSKRVRLNPAKGGKLSQKQIKAMQAGRKKAARKRKAKKSAAKKSRKASTKGKSRKARMNPKAGGKLTKAQIKAMQDGRKAAAAKRAGKKGGKKGGKKARKSGGKAAPKTEAGLRTAVTNLSHRVDNVVADMHDGLKRVNTKIEAVESGAESRFKRLTRVLEREDVISAEDRRLADKMG